MLSSSAYVASPTSGRRSSFALFTSSLHSLFSAFSAPSAVNRSPRHFPLDTLRTNVLQWPHNIGTELYTAPDQFKSGKQHLRAALLWADSFKLIAGCTKLLASPGKLNMWGFVRGIQFWGNYSSTQGRFLPKQSPLRSAEADHGPRNPGVRRPQKFNNSKTPKLGPRYIQKPARSSPACRTERIRAAVCPV
jgi:hypothetical protein